MTTPRKRRKVRNPALKVSRRNANKHFKKTRIKNDSIISANWDKKATLRQNYQRMGLMVSLNGVAGGVEKLYRDEHNPLNIEELKKNLDPDQGIIERDEQGNVINVIINKEKDEKVDTKVHPPARTDIVRELEAQASFVHKKEHHLSENERLSIEKLINKYGDDYESMFRDIKLNVYQHTAAQLKKKCQKYLLENANIKTNL